MFGLNAFYSECKMHKLWMVSMADSAIAEGGVGKLEKETHKKKNELNNWNSLSAFVVIPFAPFPFISLDFITHKIQKPNGIRNIRIPGSRSQNNRNEKAF